MVKKCNHCGECCKHIIHWMRKPRDAKYCRYILPKDNKILCKIRIEYDRLGQKKPPRIPIKHFTYWLTECKDYPNPNNPMQFVDLPKGCGFE